MPVWLEVESTTASVVGTFVQSPHAGVAEILSDLRFDFLCIDTEHSDVTALPGSFLASTEALDMPCLVRVGGNEPVLIAQALDAGAAGILVPRIDTAAAAERAIAAARFPPRGARGIGPGRASLYGRRLQEYVEAADKKLVVALQVETRRALDSLDDILAVPGFDFLFLGPADLAMSYRKAPFLPLPDIEQVVWEVIAKARQSGRRTGIYAHSIDAAREWIKAGVNMVILRSDLAFLGDMAERSLERLGRVATKTAPPTEETSQKHR